MRMYVMFSGEYVLNTDLDLLGQVEIVAAERDVYAAIMDGRVLLKIGPGDYHVDVAAWRLSESGHCFAIYEKLGSG
jgi:hypothetical protein